MKTRVWGVVFGASLLVSANALVSQEVTTEADSGGEVSTLALDLVREALQAEVEGNSTRRAAWLEEALRVDPNCASARWQAGFVRVDDQWLSVAQAQGKFGADPQLAEYRQVRESLEESPQKELLLARWCQDRQLADEARFHWLNVLRMQPDNAEALGMLGMQWSNGLLWKREQVTEQRRRDRKASGMTMNPRSAHFRRWKSRIARWELSAGRGDNNLLAAMEADLAAEASGDAILLVNHLIGRRSQEPKDPDAFQVVSLNWLTILARDPANTKFLVMHAIGHPMEPVRIAAAEELKKLPRQRYVPLLLACARFPVEFAYSVLACSGLASVHYTLDIEGLEADTQIDHVDSLNIPADFYGPQMFWRHSITGLLTTPDDVKVEVQPRFPDPIRQLYPVWFTAAALGKARDMKRLVDQYNAAGAEINQRVTEALARATGEDLQANPRVWHKWWKEYLSDYYEVDSPQRSVSAEHGGSYVPNGGGYARDLPYERPVYRYSSSLSQDWLSPAPPSPDTYISCFRGSTPVWTDIGPRAIETIRPGDRVLAQHIGTGELAYKRVEQVTKRNPTPMMKIAVGDEEILSTLGHPFWVIGQRWTMAKHLEEGCLLHTVSGPLPIAKVEQIPAAKEWYEFSYNLQVADFHTFFVGENQVLVHHLSMLSILDEGSSQVPGL